MLHPLVPEDSRAHVISVFERGELRRERRVRLPARPPLTYPLDLIVPSWPRVDAWFGFNSLAWLPGLGGRAVGRVSTVVYWCVDFVDDRFGGGGLTRVYNALDGLCCRQADARFELSQAALEAPDARHTPSAEGLAPAYVVPMGAWLDRVPTTGERQRERRPVFLGHVVPRQGAETLVRSIGLLVGRRRTPARV